MMTWGHDRRFAGCLAGSIAALLVLSVGLETAWSWPREMHRQEPVVRPSPGAQFATCATELARTGWRITRIEITSRRGPSRRLTFIMEKIGEDSGARQLSLEVSLDGKPVGFRDQVIPVPRERRRYHGEEQILRALRRGPVVSLSHEHATFWLIVARGRGTETGAVVDLHDHAPVPR